MKSIFASPFILTSIWEVERLLTGLASFWFASLFAFLSPLLKLPTDCCLNCDIIMSLDMLCTYHET